MTVRDFAAGLRHGRGQRRLPASAPALLLLAWLIASIALVYWGLFSRPFFVSRACAKLLFFPALAYGLVIGTSLVLWMLREAAAQAGLALRLLLLGVMPLALGWLGFESLARFLPSALNAAAGGAYSRLYTVATVAHDSGSDRCNHITVRELDPAASFLQLCVSQDAVDTLKPGAAVRLSGSESWFGVSVESYAYRSGV